MRLRRADYRSNLDIIVRGHPESIDRHLKRKHSRLKGGYNFLATLPEAVCSESDCDQLDKVDEVSTLSVELEGSQPP